MGDGVLVEFASVVDAVRCAAEIQQAMADHNATVADEQRIDLRIGINLGDIIVDGDYIYEDGVNVAARLQEVSEPGKTRVSGVVFNSVKNKLDLGPQRVKIIAEPVRAYRVLPKRPAYLSTR
jgi:adenylate cyclase